MINHPAIVEQEQTCSACPTQYEGRLADGRWFYFRYRHGRAILGFSTGDDPQLVRAVQDAFHGGRVVEHGDPLDGVLFGPDLDRIFAQLMDMKL